MLSGGMAGRFCDPSRLYPTEVFKPRLAPKVAGLGFFTFPIFGVQRSEFLPFFEGIDLPSTRGTFFLQTGPT